MKQMQQRFAAPRHPSEQERTGVEYRGSAADLVVGSAFLRTGFDATDGRGHDLERGAFLAERLQCLTRPESTPSVRAPSGPRNCLVE